MKKVMFLQSFLLLVISILLTNCAAYHVTIMDETGTTIKEHDTKKMYVGIGAFVPDAVIDPFVMTASLFYPFPYIKSSINVNAGIDLPRYISKMTSLAPVIFISSNVNDGNWIIFYDDKGNIISYSGFNYSLSRKSKIEFEIE